MMKTCFLFVLLMLIQNGLAFRNARQYYKKPGLSPLSLFMKRVGWSLSSLDKKICDAQADIDEIEDERMKPIDRIDDIELTLFGAQNSGLDGRDELASDDGLVSEVDKIKGKQDNDILGPGGLKGDVLALQTDCCGEAGLGQDIADLQMTVTEETNGLVDKVAALEDDLDKDGGVLECLVDLKTTVDTATTGLVDKVAALETTVDTANTGLVDKVAALEISVDTDTTGLVDKVADLEMTVTEETNGLVDKVAALEMDCCDEGDMRISSLESTVDGINGLAEKVAYLEWTDSNGINGHSEKIAALEDDLDKDGGVLECLRDLKTTVDTATTGLVDKVAALEISVDADTTGLVDKVAALKTTVDTANTGLVDKVADLETIVDTANTGLVDKVAALETKTAANSGRLVALEAIPVQCLMYNLLLDSKRSIDTSSTIPFNCDTSVWAELGVTSNTENYEWKGDGWYRFSGAAGCMIPESAPSVDKCGTSASGWMDDTHPTADYQTKNVQFCFNWTSGECTWSTQGKVTNCGQYYVYYLVDVHTLGFNNCNLGYCGTNSVAV